MSDEARSLGEALRHLYEQEATKKQATLHDDKRFQAACAAMQGLLAADPESTWTPEEVGKAAVRLADKLLQALEGEKP